MKKGLMILALLCSFTTGTFAIQTPNVEEQKAVNQNTAAETKKLSKENMSEYMLKFNELVLKYIENFRSCDKASFVEDLDFFGFKFSLNMKLNGWNTENKCTFEMNACLGGLGKNVRDIFAVPFSDETLAKLSPKIRCEFTKNDLNVIADAFIERNEKNMAYYKETLLNPEKEISFDKNSSYKKEMTPKEKKAMELITGGNICSILNKDELMKTFMELK